MILERLKELALRVSDELPPPGYAKMKIRWIIELDKDGELLGVIKTEGEGGKPKFIEQMAPNPNLTGKRAVNIKAGLLADTAEYVLGKPSASKEGRPERLAQMHSEFCAKVTACAETLDMPDIIAIQAFLHDGALADQPMLKDVDGGDWVTFRVDGNLPIDDPRVRDYWGQSQSDTKHSGTCMMCGTASVPLVDLQPVTLKPVPGGQSGGVQLISANTDVFESYGLESALIAPMCRQCAELSHNAINYLINSPKHSYRIRDQVVFLFWSREPSPFSIPGLFGEPTEDTVKTMLSAPLTGHAYAATDKGMNTFYVLALSGSGGRAVVRDWIETSLNNVQDNLRRYFHAQHIAGGREPYQKLMALAGATVRDLDELAPWVSLALVEHALKGTPLPPALLSAAVRRCAVGKTNPGTRKREHVNAQQAALVKLCLVSLSNQQGIAIGENWMIKLDITQEEPAYLYGRLFNVLEQIQEAATGGDSVERTFGTAIMSPVSTLPRQIARSTVHIRKLMRDKPGYAVHYNKLLSEIQGKLDVTSAFKKQLDAHEQGLFVLGYWHQNAARYEKRPESENINA
jgi:CRISPR-associated protein Csd1